MPCNMIGTAIIDVHRCTEIARRHSSASKRSCSTTVERSGVLICNAARPQLWNSGAEISIVSFICNGIRDSIAATVPNPFGVGLRALFGAPLVPEVSTSN